MFFARRSPEASSALLASEDAPVTRSSERRRQAAADKPARKAGFVLSLKGRALRYLAAREHSRAELERKLAPHEETPGQLAQVLDDLQAKDFISEARVVESVINRRSSRLGASRVRQELQAKGLDSARINEAIAGLQSTEYERALELWRRRFGELSTDPKVKARQARFLMSRGFAGGIVSRILRLGGDED